MRFLVVKHLVTAGLVVLVSEVAKRAGRIGALIGATPLVALLALLWMHFEGQPESRLSTYASYTFWYVLPTLPIFLVFPRLLPGIGLWPARGAGIPVGIPGFVILAAGGRRSGLDLTP